MKRKILVVILVVLFLVSLMQVATVFAVKKAEMCRCCGWVYTSNGRYELICRKVPCDYLSSPNPPRAGACDAVDT